jgi:hypothetical protein
VAQDKGPEFKPQYHKKIVLSLLSWLCKIIWPDVPQRSSPDAEQVCWDIYLFSTSKGTWMKLDAWVLLPPSGLPLLLCEFCLQWPNHTFSRMHHFHIYFTWHCTLIRWFITNVPEICILFIYLNTEIESMAYCLLGKCSATWVMPQSRNIH